MRCDSDQRDTAMNLATTRFGAVTIDDGDVLTFAGGLIGMEDCCRWTLLADAQNQAPRLAAEPRPVVTSLWRWSALAASCPDYRVRVSRRDVEPLGLERPEDAQVLVIVNQVGDRLVLNLKAPLVVHLESRRGRQIVARDDHAVQFLLTDAPALRKSA